jgi:hypothetical protein
LEIFYQWSIKGFALAKVFFDFAGEQQTYNANPYEAW